MATGTQHGLHAYGAVISDAYRVDVVDFDLRANRSVHADAQKFWIPDACCSINISRTRELGTEAT